MHQRNLILNTDCGIFIFYSRILRNHKNWPKYVCFTSFPVDDAAVGYEEKFLGMNLWGLMLGCWGKLVNEGEAC